MKHTYFVILLALVLFSACKGDKSNLHLSSENSIVVNNIDEWSSSKTNPTRSVDCQKMILTFWNNPYKLDSTYNIIISLNDSTVIYKGKFVSGLDVLVPRNLFESYLEPKLAIFKDNKSYYLINKTTLQVLTDDKYLYIVFMPDRKVVGGCMIFSSRVQLE